MDRPALTAATHSGGIWGDAVAIKTTVFANKSSLTLLAPCGLNWASTYVERCVMSTQSPLAPKLTDNVTVHIVLNDFGELGRAFLETDELEVDEWTIISKIISGEYSNPVRVVAFNIAEGWSRDVTEDIAQAVIDRGRRENYFSEVAKKFVERTLGETVEIVR
jgi:hypothetical protein